MRPRIRTEIGVLLVVGELDLARAHGPEDSRRSKGQHQEQEDEEAESAAHVDWF